MKRRAAVFLFWIAVWQILNMAVNNDILLAGPWETMVSLSHMLFEGDFWRSVGNSMLRIYGGMFTGGLLGVLSAALAYRYRIFEELVTPLVGVLKSIPVASFVILVLIWAGNRNLSFFITALVVFPILYLNTRSGLASVDPGMKEMAQVFELGLGERIRYIYLPHLVPFFQSSFQLAAGMSWKSGVAAEVIGQPLLSVGNGLYRAKIYLATGEVFAWTITVVFLSWATEQLAGRLAGRKEKKPAPAGPGKDRKGGEGT